MANSTRSDKPPRSVTSGHCHGLTSAVSSHSRQIRPSRMSLPAERTVPDPRGEPGMELFWLLHVGIGVGPMGGSPWGTACEAVLRDVPVLRKGNPGRVRLVP